MAKRFGRRSLARLLTLVMAFSLFQITALAAGELTCCKTEHSRTDACYRIHNHNLGCILGCRYDDGESYLACGKEDSQTLAVQLRLHGTEYEILRWQAMSTVDWQADDSLPVWDGETE